MLKKIDVNTKALLDLADYFDRLSHEDYDQSKFSKCICGHCNRRHMYQDGDTRRAARTLGLTMQQANQLFKQDGGMHEERLFFATRTVLPTPADAARALRYIAVTGEVPPDW